MCVTPPWLVIRFAYLSLSPCLSLSLDGFVNERRDNLQEKEVSCGLTQDPQVKDILCNCNSVVLNDAIHLEDILKFASIQRRLSWFYKM